jgi:hypothetical protein
MSTCPKEISMTKIEIEWAISINTCENILAGSYWQVQLFAGSYRTGPIIGWFL